MTKAIVLVERDGDYDAVPFRDMGYYTPAFLYDLYGKDVDGMIAHLLHGAQNGGYTSGRSRITLNAVSSSEVELARGYEAILGLDFDALYVYRDGCFIAYPSLDAVYKK